MRIGIYLEIDETLRHDFRQWCLDNNTTMAAELRRHIENVVYWCVGPRKGDTVTMGGQVYPDRTSDYLAQQAVGARTGSGTNIPGLEVGWRNGET